jgi:hypothetical protein
VSAPAEALGSGTGTGRPMTVLATGAAMLAVPTVMVLVAPHATSAAAARALALVAIGVLAVGAGAVVAAVVRPRATGVPMVAVLAAGLALLLSPPEPWAAGATGLAALAFVLAGRWHAATATRPAREAGEWLAARRPLLVGAVVTTPAALAAALVPGAWSLPVAGLVGLVVAGLCTGALARG